MDVCWIGGIPAHYTRVMHRQLEDELQENIRYLYISRNKKSREREYEHGEFPKACEFFRGRDCLAIWKILKLSSPKIVIIAGNYPRLVLIGFVWASLNKRSIAYWSDTNILDFERKGKLRKVIIKIWNRILFSRVDTFLYTGTRNRDYYEFVVGRKYLQGRLCRVPYPALVHYSDKKATYEREIIRLLYVGRLISLKCVDSLINAIALLTSDMRVKTTLTIVGDGGERAYLEALVKKKDLSKQIQFLGAMPSNKVSKVYSEHDVLVLPSNHEPWGLVVNEALGAGLPVIAPYWVGAVSDLVIDGYSGYVIEDNQPTTIKLAILRALHVDRKELEEMGKSGAMLVRAGGFNLDGATHSMSNFIKKSISNG